MDEIIPEEYELSAPPVTLKDIRYIGVYINKGKKGKFHLKQQTEYFNGLVITRTYPTPLDKEDVCLMATSVLEEYLEIPNEENNDK